MAIEREGMTNADRIRQMTDEELAEFFPGYKFGWNCPPKERDGCLGECISCWLNWLKTKTGGERRMRLIDADAHGVKFIPRCKKG